MAILDRAREESRCRFAKNSLVARKKNVPERDSPDRAKEA
jgi:hypothetical protein